MLNDSLSLLHVDIDELLAVCDLSLPDIPLCPQSPVRDPQHQFLTQHTVLPAWLVSPPLLASQRRRKRTAERRKDEIEQLRRQVDGLQDHLESIRLSQKNPRRVVLNPPSEGTAHHLWLMLAQRQESERRRVEEENAKLRDALSSQDKLIWNLQRVLRQAEARKHKALDSRVIFLMVWFHCLQKWNRDLLKGPNLDTTSEDYDVISFLVANVDKQLLLSSQPDANYQPERQGDKLITQILKDPDGGYLYERERAQVFPFSADLVNNVRWSTLSSGGIHFVPQPATVVTDDLIISTINFQSSPFEGLGEPELLGIKTHLVMKRRQHLGRMVTAWESVSFIPESKALGTPALRWVQRARNIIWPQQLQDGTEGCVSWARIRAKINVQGDAEANLGERGLKLFHLMAAALEEVGKRAEQLFENKLIMETTNKRRRLM